MFRRGENGLVSSIRTAAIEDGIDRREGGSLEKAVFRVVAAYLMYRPALTGVVNVCIDPIKQVCPAFPPK
jgi:hypothetical protein